MYKEIVITTIIIILIIIGNIITQNNTNKSVETISSELSMFRQNIIKENVDKEAVEKIENIWNEKYEKMAYYIEHDELEKVETELAKLKADIEVKNYSLAVENIDNCVFILEHIKDKTALKIVNIF